MNTQDLIHQAKARFAHNAAREYLKEKFNGKLLTVDQNGLWKADPATISLLNSLDDPEVVLLDTFEKPVLVDRKMLLSVLTKKYSEVMKEYYLEWSKIGDIR